MASPLTSVYLGLGSNIDRVTSLQRGIKLLRDHYGELRCSSVYESDAVGFSGPPFLNMALGIHTTLSVPAMIHELREIEKRFGRTATSARFCSRRLDIDILLFGGLVGEFDGVHLPRYEILYNAHVLAPLSELLPDFHHPIASRSLKEIWENSPKKNKVKKVRFWYDLQPAAN